MHVWALGLSCETPAAFGAKIGLAKNGLAKIGPGQNWPDQNKDGQIKMVKTGLAQAGLPRRGGEGATCGAPKGGPPLPPTPNLFEVWGGGLLPPKPQTSLGFGEGRLLPPKTQTSPLKPVSAAACRRTVQKR